MKKTILFFGLILGSQLLGMTAANAAQTAKVIVDSASVLDKPQPDGIVVGTVPKDTSIAVSNVPTNGYFKSRIPGGTIGWISGNDILAGAAPVPTPSAVAQATPTPQPPQAKKNEKKKKEADSAPVNDHLRLMISGGLQILNNGGFPAEIPITGSKTGYGGTVEMQFKLNELFYLAGRAEYFLSSSSQTVSSSVTQTLKFHTLPVMAGIVYVPVNKQNFRFGLGLYLGFSLLTSLTVTQSSALNSATVTYTSTDICEYGNLQGSYAITSGMSILGDFGYRLHNASYPASANLNTAAFKANFGGLVARMGLEFKL